MGSRFFTHKQGFANEITMVEWDGELAYIHYKWGKNPASAYNLEDMLDSVERGTWVECDAEGELLPVASFPADLLKTLKVVRTHYRLQIDADQFDALHVRDNERLVDEDTLRYKLQEIEGVSDVKYAQHLSGSIWLVILDKYDTRSTWHHVARIIEEHIT